MSVVGTKTVPKDVHHLIPGTCDDATFHDKMDFAGVIKCTGLEMGTVAWILQVGPM